MPTYEYACTACGHQLEAVQKFSDDPLTECPECGGALRKVYGDVGIVLQGQRLLQDRLPDRRRMRAEASGTRIRHTGQGTVDAKAIWVLGSNRSSGAESSSKDGSKTGSGRIGRLGGSGDVGNKDSKPAAARPPS